MLIAPACVDLGHLGYVSYLNYLKNVYEIFMNPRESLGFLNHSRYTLGVEVIRRQSMMRNKVKWFFSIIAILILAPWLAVNVYAYSGDMADQDAVQTLTAEAPVVINAVAVDLITIVDGVLPSHVYVLNNREIVTEKTWNAINNNEGAVAESTSDSQTASSQGTIVASVKVMPSRLILVDEQDRIIEVWSNTTGTEQGFYSLRVQELSVQGLEHPLTQEILEQYAHLLGEVDWNSRDRVY